MPYTREIEISVVREPQIRDLTCTISYADPKEFKKVLRQSERHKKKGLKINRKLLRSCPICGKRPKVKITHGNHPCITIQCKPWLRDVHCRVIWYGEKGFVRAKSATDFWNEKIDKYYEEWDDGVRSWIMRAAGLPDNFLQQIGGRSRCVKSS